MSSSSHIQFSFFLPVCHEYRVLWRTFLLLSTDVRLAHIFHFPYAYIFRIDTWRNGLHKCRFWSLSDWCWYSEWWRTKKIVFAFKEVSFYERGTPDERQGAQDWGIVSSVICPSWVVVFFLRRLKLLLQNRDSTPYWKYILFYAEIQRS